MQTENSILKQALMCKKNTTKKYVRGKEQRMKSW